MSVNAVGQCLRSAKNYVVQKCRRSELPSAKIAVGQKCRQSKRRWSKMPSVKNAFGQNCRRSKLPSVKNAVDQKCRQSKMPSVKNFVGQKFLRSKQTPKFQYAVKIRVSTLEDFEVLSKPLLTLIEEIGNFFGRDSRTLNEKCPNKL
jgi:hypothetical protein